MGRILDEKGRLAESEPTTLGFVGDTRKALLVDKEGRPLKSERRKEERPMDPLRALNDFALAMRRIGLVE